MFKAPRISEKREGPIPSFLPLCYQIADDVDAYGRSLAAASPTSAVGETDVIEDFLLNRDSLE